ncbi:MAG: hypothetical protein HUJ56_02645 [Erysipelotrichaceae bacterium]|nr:hypothetical protein [Erysipelotrichaceae bacterium]
MCEAMDEIKRKVAEVNLKQGREEGRVEGAILICRNLGVGFEKTVNQIASQFKMDISEAEAITKRYWEFD